MAQHAHHIAPEDEPDLSDEELLAFKQRLEREAEEIKAQLNNLREELREASQPSAEEAEQATLSDDRHRLLTRIDGLRRKSAMIDAALQRMKHGNFGICEGSGDFIGRSRLNLTPWTPFSIAHQETLERHARHRVAPSQES
jgi:DnaK suppressor protein